MDFLYTRLVCLLNNNGLQNSKNKTFTKKNIIDDINNVFKKKKEDEDNRILAINQKIQKENDKESNRILAKQKKERKRQDEIIKLAEK